MWASDCVYFLGFLCHHRAPALCSVHSWTFPFCGMRGGRTVHARQISFHQGLTMDELCGYINIYFSHPPNPPASLITSSLWANHQREEQGSVHHCLCLWEMSLVRRVPWLTLTLHIVPEMPPAIVLISALWVCLPIFICALYSSCAFMRCRSDI